MKKLMLCLTLLCLTSSVHALSTVANLDRVTRVVDQSTVSMLDDFMEMFYGFFGWDDWDM